ncbi:MAG: gluconate 2-dehydrogenase subunit 3 family protein [Sinomicrobium sp.]|nr:gluconate 2-dehydrogenase subunit 3 family protein [Sinomicrobium sp.]
MDRRAALKHIGLSAGFIAVTPTLISLLQSCKNEYVINWTPELLSLEEAKAVDQLVDLIIPETDIPGAKALNVPMFIDKYASQIAKVEDAQFFKAGAGITLKELGAGEEKPVDDIPVETYDALLTKYLKQPKEKQQKYREQMARTSPEDFGTMPQEVIVFNFLAAVRNISVYAYRNTEYVGENVLSYLPVPGSQIGCAPLKELTGGKSWSL